MSNYRDNAYGRDFDREGDWNQNQTRGWEQGKDWQRAGGYDRNKDWEHGNDRGQDFDRGRVRRREDDEYNDYGGESNGYQGGRGYNDAEEGDWKRRKTDQDYYQGGREYDGGEGSHKHYKDNSEEYYQDDRDGYGNRGRDHSGPRRRHIPSEPSLHVIFLGLDPDFTEADLHNFLAASGYSIESATIIRDRATGLSKNFGFAHFSDIEQARAFVTPNFPFIALPPPSSHGIQHADMSENSGHRVKIDFSQSAGGDNRRQGARDGGRPNHSSNDGTRDIGSVPVPVVLLKGLDYNGTLENIAEALRGAEGPAKEGAKGMKRVLLIRDKETNLSRGYAFVEFTDIQHASALLAAVMSPQLHTSGFRILSRPVAASFAHPYSFKLLGPHDISDESCITASVAVGGKEEGWSKYWDETAFAAELAFKVAPPVKEVEKTKEKKKEKYKESHKKASSSVAPTALLSTGGPVSLNLKGIKLAEAAERKAVATSVNKPLLGFAEDPPAEDSEADDDSANTDRANASRKVAPMIASKKVANNINKWNQVQGELSSNTDNPPAPATSAPVAQPLRQSAATSSSNPGASPPQDENEFEFGDPAGRICLLCGRQFKTVDQLRRHNKESDLHKKNLQDANLRDTAREKARACNSKSQDDGAAGQPKYRDRALERRITYGQPDVPVSATSGKSAGKGKHAEPLPPPPPPPPSAPVAPMKDETNVGNKLLKKMGWAEGSGLGTSGEGRVDPIQTALYAQGVGLGASKAKELDLNSTRGFTFSNMAKDLTRERYGS